MRYRKLGRSGVTVSVVGLGTWQFGGEWGKRFSQAEVDSLLRRAAELGVNLIDTAECYGDHLSESLIGRAIARNRDSWIVATKFGHRFHADRIAKANWDVSELRTDAWSPREVVAQLDASLRALQTDYVDVYQSHGGQDAPFNSPQLWETLQQEVAKGKIRHLGISLDATDVDQTKLAPEVNADVIQVTYNRLNRVAEEGVLPASAHADLGVLAREPLANGYLSGKYRPGHWVTSRDDWRSSHNPQEADAQLQAVSDIEAQELPDGIPLAQWAVAWPLQHHAVATVIPGCRNIEQLEGNAAAANLDLVSDTHPLAAPQAPRTAAG
jgi:aryl-alcohol dehydrogenase-like predicted oxidoreductase